MSEETISPETPAANRHFIRQIIDNDLAAGVVEGLVVAAGIEGADEAFALQLVFGGDPIGDGVEDDRRGVAVVGRFLRLVSFFA